MSDQHQRFPTITVCLMMTAAEVGQPAYSAIQSIRAIHDRAYDRWPPHVTLLPPTQLPMTLIQSPQALHAALANSAKSLTSFHLALDAVAILPHKHGSCHIILEPTSTEQQQSLAALHITLEQALFATFVDAPAAAHAFKPHLSLASLSKGDDVQGVMAEANEAIFGSVKNQAVQCLVDRAFIMIKHPGKGQSYHRLPELDLVFADAVEAGAAATSSTSLAPFIADTASVTCYGFNQGSQFWEGVDNIPSPATTISEITTIPKVLTFNVLNTTSDIKDRFPAISAVLQDSDADVILLQEVTPAFLELLQNEIWVQETYHLSHITNSTASATLSLLALSRTPFSSATAPSSSSIRPPLVITLPGVTIATTHFASDFAKDNSARRKIEWNDLVSYLTANAPATSVLIVAGDFNASAGTEFTDSLTLSGFQDAWTQVSHPNKKAGGGYTFDPVRNPRARATWDAQGKTDRTEGKRLDRILFCSPRSGDCSVWPDSCEILGANVDDEDGGHDVGSDHFPLMCRWVYSRGDSAAAAATLASSEASTVAISEFTSPLSTTLIAAEDEPLAQLLQAECMIPTESDRDARVKVLALLNTTFKQLLTPSPFRLEPVGSYALNTYTPSSDLDVLVVSIINAGNFFRLVSGEEEDDAAEDQAQLEQPAAAGSQIRSLRDVEGVQLIRLVLDARVPIADLSVLGVSVQIQYACMVIPIPDPKTSLDSLIMSALSPPSFAAESGGSRITHAVALSPATRMVISSRADVIHILSNLKTPEVKQAFSFGVRFLRLWMSKRGLSSSTIASTRFGGVCTHAVTLMAAQAAMNLLAKTTTTTAITASNMITTFFSMMAAWDPTRDIFTCDFNTLKRYNDPQPSSLTDSPPRKATARPRIAVDEQNRIVVVSSSAPFVNVTRAVSYAMRDIWVEETRRGADLGQDFTQIAGALEFLSGFESFVKVDISAATPSKFAGLVGQVEGRLLAFHAMLARRCAGVSVRMWPARWVEDGDDYKVNGCYLFGLKKKPTVTLSPEEKLQATTTFQEVLSQFQEDVTTRWSEYTTTMWGQVSHIKKANLPAGLTLSPAIAFVPVQTVATPRPPSPTTALGRIKKPISKSNKSNNSIFVATENTEPKVKLRTSQDVFDRIMWDDRFDESDWIIGYEDRFTGMQEMPFNEFAKNRSDSMNEDWIPFHRVWYFRTKEGEVMWDRKERIDKVFTSNPALSK